MLCIKLSLCIVELENGENNAFRGQSSEKDDKNFN